MQQYFGSKKENNIIYLKKEDLNHIQNVMRMKENDEVLVVLENKKYLCKLNKSLESSSIINEIEETNSSQNIVFYIPVLTKDKMSYVLQKGTELGVTTFIPVEYERCKFKLTKEQKIKKIDRWNKIVKSASEQSHRISIPKVLDIINAKEIEKSDGVNILCSLDKKNVKSIKEVLTERNVCDTINVLYGPEGGLTPTEEDLFVSKGYTKTSLGNLVLRTETVILTVSSIILYLKGD